MQDIIYYIRNHILSFPNRNIFSSLIVLMMHHLMHQTYSAKYPGALYYNSYNHMLMVAKFVAKNKKQLIICYTHTLFY
ncbi:hypothetical protein AZZ60_000583, partial [Escherichia coli]